MRKSIVMAVAALLGLGLSTGCSDKKTQEQNQQLEGEVSSLVATQDSLLMLFNDITEGMNQIKELEGIISTPGALSAETPSRKEQIKNDIVAIHKALEERRLRLEELEKRLEASGIDNSTLRRTITSLKAQIADQKTEIAQLTNQLAAANIRIQELDETVAQQGEQIEGLNQAVENESREREIAQGEAQRATEELNACYYCIGTSKELKTNKILESGFLKKTKVMQGDVNYGYFTQADKRTLLSIPTGAKKAKILTNMPAGSYTIADVDGLKVVQITDPAKFWSLSNFLVIKVD